jgi:hypothetical protein
LEKDEFDELTDDSDVQDEEDDDENGDWPEEDAAKFMSA